MKGYGEDLPDYLRCSRSDGRQWRCVRRAMENKKLCKAHYLQARHRQYKRKVPDSLKLKRKTKRERIGNEEFFGPSYQERFLAKAPEKLAKLLRKKKKKRSRPSVVLMEAALDKALMNGKKLKKKGLPLELMRVFLHRQIERKYEKQRLENGICKGELTLDLPNGLMAISPAPAPTFCNAGFFCDKKLGLDSDSLIMRCIRSKNIEPLQFGSFNVVPYGRNIAGLRQVGKRNCHQCGRSNLLGLVWCPSCQTESFCIDCTKDWTRIWGR